MVVIGRRLRFHCSGPRTNRCACLVHIFRQAGQRNGDRNIYDPRGRGQPTGVPADADMVFSADSVPRRHRLFGGLWNSLYGGLVNRYVGRTFDRQRQREIGVALS